MYDDERNPKLYLVESEVPRVKSYLGLRKARSEPESKKKKFREESLTSTLIENFMLMATLICVVWPSIFKAKHDGASHPPVSTLPPTTLII